MIPKIKKIGVFGGPAFKIGLINKNVGLFSGGQGGVILNNSFIIGGGGYDLSTKVDAGSINPEMDMNMNYGGLILGYLNKSNSAVHYNVQVLLGGGDVSWSAKNGWYIFKDWNNKVDEFGYDSFFAIEPSFGLEMRLTKFFEMDFGISYLFALDVSSLMTVTGDNGQTFIKTIGNKDLSGISGNIKFKFILSDLQMITDLFDDIIKDIDLP